MRKVLTKRNFITLVANQHVPFQKVRVLKDCGEDLGILAISEALSRARIMAKDLVLIEVIPEPVCLLGFRNKIERLFSKKKLYEEIVSEGSSFDPSSRVKQIFLSDATNTIDYEMKMLRLRKFLLSKHRCELYTSNHSMRFLSRVRAEILDLGNIAYVDDEYLRKITIWPIAIARIEVD